jgi:hypothetical protein
MTSKAKAEKLFNKFIIIDDLSDSTGNSLYFNAHAKQCAIVAVDEIIEATNMYQYGINNSLEHIPAKIVKHPYWQEVKQEIENL